MKLPRKLKKQVIKAFGYGTYKGIQGDYLKLINSTFNKRRCLITKRTEKQNINDFYHEGQILIHTHLF